MAGKPTYAELVARTAAAREERAQAEGAYAEMLKQIKADFGLKSLEEAEAELVRVRKRKARLDRAEAEAVAEVSRKWKHKLKE